MDLSIFMFWSDSQIVFWCAVIVTAVALTISTGYTLKSLFNVWNSKKLKIPSSASTSATGSVSVSDADDKTTKDDIGCDGDAEPDAEVDKQTENTFEDGSGDNEHSLGGRDPLDYCSHIQGEVKRVKQRVTTKKIQENLTEDQLEEERKIQREQLEYIFKLMADQGEKFGITSMDDVKQQMKLYA